MRLFTGALALGIHAAEAAPMMVTGPVVGGQDVQMLQMKGIDYFPAHQVTKVEAGRLHFADGATADFDQHLYVPPHRAPTVVKAAGLCAESGWIAVDSETMETQFPGVHAIGDVTSIPLKMGRPLPKAGVFAHGQAGVVARNIARAWTGKGAAARFGLALTGQAFLAMRLRLTAGAIRKREAEAWLLPLLAARLYERVPGEEARLLRAIRRRLRQASPA